MNFSANVSPNFKSQEIFDSTIRKSWFEFQEAIYDLGDSVLAYLQNYINGHAKRKSNSGLLARSMDIKKIHGPAEIGFLIGEIAKLPSYWRIINYGGMTTAGLMGWTIQGYFGGGNAPDSAKAGSGVGDERFHSQWNSFAMKPQSPIKPMNYIEAVDLYTNLKIKTIINTLRKG